MKRFISFLQRRSPELYFRFMERYGERKIQRTIIGFGDFIEEYGWEYRGRFYPKHYRVEAKPPLTIRQQAGAKIERQFRKIGMLEFRSPKQ